MENGWVVFWSENGKKFKRNGFEGNSPRASGAIDYAKSVIARGIPVANVHVVSKRKGFAPPPAQRESPGPDYSWCPYCIRWRVFRIYGIRKDGFTVPPDYRCPVCTISVNDHYVRKHNPLLVARAEAKLVRTGKPRDPSTGQLLRGRRARR